MYPVPMSATKSNSCVSCSLFCLLLAACGGPVPTPSTEADAARAPAEEVAEPTPEQPAEGTGIECGATRCTEDKPHCCAPMGAILDTSEPQPEPHCVVDHTHCPGRSYKCKGQSDCPEGQHCVHDATVNTNYCDDDITDVLIVCSEDSDCAVRCGETAPLCRDGKCDCAD